MLLLGGPFHFQRLPFHCYLSQGNLCFCSSEASEFHLLEWNHLYSQTLVEVESQFLNPGACAEFSHSAASWLWKPQYDPCLVICSESGFATIVDVIEDSELGNSLKYFTRAYGQLSSGPCNCCAWTRFFLASYSDNLLSFVPPSHPLQSQYSIPLECIRSISASPSHSLLATLKESENVSFFTADRFAISQEFRCDIDGILAAEVHPLDKKCCVFTRAGILSVLMVGEEEVVCEGFVSVTEFMEEAVLTGEKMEESPWELAGMCIDSKEMIVLLVAMCSTEQAPRIFLVDICRFRVLWHWNIKEQWTLKEKVSSIEVIITDGGNVLAISAHTDKYCYVLSSPWLSTGSSRLPVCSQIAIGGGNISSVSLLRVEGGRGVLASSHFPSSNANPVRNVVKTTYCGKWVSTLLGNGSVALGIVSPEYFLGIEWIEVHWDSNEQVVQAFPIGDGRLLVETFTKNVAIIDVSHVHWNKVTRSSGKESRHADVRYLPLKGRLKKLLSWGELFAMIYGKTRCDIYDSKTRKCVFQGIVSVSEKNILDVIHGPSVTEPFVLVCGNRMDGMWVEKLTCKINHKVDVCRGRWSGVYSVAPTFSSNGTGFVFSLFTVDNETIFCCVIRVRKDDDELEVLGRQSFNHGVGDDILPVGLLYPSFILANLSPSHSCKALDIDTQIHSIPLGHMILFSLLCSGEVAAAQTLFLNTLRNCEAVAEDTLELLLYVSACEQNEEIPIDNFREFISGCPKADASVLRVLRKTEPSRWKKMLDVAGISSARHLFSACCERALEDATAALPVVASIEGIHSAKKAALTALPAALRSHRYGDVGAIIQYVTRVADGDPGSPTSSSSNWELLLRRHALNLLVSNQYAALAKIAEFTPLNICDLFTEEKERACVIVNMKSALDDAEKNFRPYGILPSSAEKHVNEIYSAALECGCSSIAALCACVLRDSTKLSEAFQCDSKQNNIEKLKETFSGSLSEEEEYSNMIQEALSQ